MASLRRPSWSTGNRPAAVHLVARDGGHDLDDATIVSGLRAGEDWAARLAWNRYAPMVFGVLDRALGYAGESEDLIQEVFGRVFASIGALRDPRALRSYIYSSALRMLWWHRRTLRIRRLLMVSESGELPEPAAQEQDPEGRELLARFYRLLDALGPQDRTAFVLRHVEGLNVEEIANLTKSSLATVKRRMRRASQRVEILVKADPDLVPYFKRAGGADET